jgi:hypothetical protein
MSVWLCLSYLSICTFSLRNYPADENKNLALRVSLRFTGVFAYSFHVHPIQSLNVTYFINFVKHIGLIGQNIGP